MNSALRHVHWKTFRILRYLLPGLLLVSLMGYRFLETSQLPPSLFSTLPEGAEREHYEDVEQGQARIRVEVFRAPSAELPGVKERWLQLTPLKPMRQPDVFVYWSARAGSYEEPPLGASLIGMLDSRTTGVFRLPSQASFLNGYIVLFSVAENVLIVQAQLPQSF